MRKPEKPIPSDCCGTGCDLCVYELYNQRMDKYREWLKQQEERENETES